MASEKFMSENNLQYFWDKLEARLAKKVSTDDERLTLATASKNGLFSSADFTKLSGIEAGANKYVHPTTSGNKHIPSGGSSGQILRWFSDGTAVWGNDVNTTYENFTGASASVVGASGLVPAPNAGDQAKFLCGDGTWKTTPDTNTTYEPATSTEDGLMSAADKAKLDSIQTDATNTDGFVQFDAESDIPVGSRKANTLYARIIHDYSA